MKQTPKELDLISDVVGVDQELKELRLIAGLPAVEPTPPTEDAGSGEAKL